MLIEYWQTKLPKCPYCGNNHPVWDQDYPISMSYEDGGRFEITCTHCDKEFICETSVEYRFSTAVSDEAANEEEWGPGGLRDDP